MALLRSCGYLLSVLLGISFLSFSLFALAPGDPAAILLNIHHETPTQQQIDELRRELHLDQPLQLRYVHWLIKVMHGDFGRSWRNGETVTRVIGERVPATLELALAAWLLLIFFLITYKTQPSSAPAGVMARFARRHSQIGRSFAPVRIDD